MKSSLNNCFIPYPAIRMVVTSLLAIEGFASLVHAGNVWDGGGTAGAGLWNWSDVVNWDADVAPTLPGSLTFAGTTGLLSNNDLTGPTTVNGLTFDAGAGIFVVSGNAVTLAGNITNSSNDLQTINLALAMTGDRIVTTSATGGVTLGGLISGTVNFNKSGAGALTVAGTANTYSGITVMNAGIWNAASFSNFGVPSSLGSRASDAGGNVGLLFRGGTLQYTGSTAQSTNRGVRVSPAGGTIDASGSNPAATLSFTAATSADFLETGGNRTFTLTGSNTGDNTFGIVINQSGGTTSFTKIGTGTWLLTGANSYTGTTTINEGTLKNGSATTFTNKGGLAVGGTAILDLNGFNASFTNNVANSATSTITNNGSADATLSFPGGANGTNSFVKDGPTHKLTLSFTNNNSGSVRLVNNGNTFSGGLYLNNSASGTRLRVQDLIVTTGTPGAIISSNWGTGPITIGGIATDKAGILFDLAANNTMPNAIVFNTALGTDFPGIRFETTGTVLSGAITANSDAAFSGGGSATISGVISGAGGLSKTGTGTLALSGANVYAGVTTASAGVVAVNGASIPDSGKLFLSGGKLSIPESVNEKVAKLFFDGAEQPAGTYGSVASGAEHPDDTRFLGTGILTVVASAGGYAGWAATNVGGAAANVDTDLDGVRNGVEYFMNAAPGFTPNPGLVVAAGPVRTISWTNGGNIPSTAYGTQFYVQTSPDLALWTEVLAADPKLTNTAGSVTYTLPADAGKSFVRLIVIPQ